MLVWLGLCAFAAAQQPNVIVILSDDQGTMDIGAAGTPHVVTPTLDKLAAEGIRFTQFYAASSICSPSRASLLTGRYPWRCGVPGNVSPGGPGLPLTEVTMAEVFRAAGYTTALIGKWHLGTTLDQSPLQQGFDRYFGHRQGCIDNWSHFFYWNGPNRHDLWMGDEVYYEDGSHFGDMMVREAVSFMRENKAHNTLMAAMVDSQPPPPRRPFFLYLPFNTPHYPMQPKAKWRSHFATKAYAGLEQRRRDYLALLATMDEQLGKILAEVERLGQRENTIVVFQSDHGHSTEQRAFYGGGSAGQFRGAKFSLFEGGIRVPAVISWPGKIGGSVTWKNAEDKNSLGGPYGINETRDQVAHATDWLPTLAELANIPLLPGMDLDGKSLVPVLNDPSAKSAHEVLHWVVSDQWAVRRGDFKLIVNPRDTDRSRLTQQDERHKFFLVNLAEDIAEQNNIRGREGEQLKALRELHAKALAEFQDK